MRAYVLPTWFMVAVTIATPTIAQNLPVDSLFVANRLPVTFDGRRASGPGWDLILDAARDAQFVMVGESHNVREIPLFTLQLFESLHQRYGFNYLALEDGPYAVEQYVMPGVRGNLDSAYALAVRYVQALQFRNDQELELLAAAGRISTAPEHPVWGIDNTWGTLHILERLAQLAPTPESRTLAGELVAESSVMEAERPDGNARFITDSLTGERLENLRRAFANAPPEAMHLIGYLQTGFEIYAARTSGPAIYTANNRREHLMRAQFMSQYRHARDHSDQLPRVVLKFGQWHAMKGINWGDVHALGLFLSEFAKSNEMTSLHIWTGLVNEPGHFWTLNDFEDYVALGAAGSPDSWYIIDLRDIRPYVAAGRVRGMNDELYKVIFGFDLALLIGGGNPATHDQLEGER